MSESDSSLNFSDIATSDDDIPNPDKLYENLMFYLICQEPDVLKTNRKITGKRDRSCPLNFIDSWSDEMFLGSFLLIFRKINSAFR